MNDAKTRELLKEIKAKGLFATTRRLQEERRAAMPQGFAFRINYTAGSKLSGGGMTVGKDNRPTRIPNSDPEVHRSKSVIVNPLIVTTITAEDEEVESSPDDTTELSLAEPVAEAGTDTPDESEEDVQESEELDGSEVA